MTPGIRILVATSLLSAILGSVHAFSVFLAPLERQFVAERGQVSLTYSLALVSLTLAVLWGHRIYGRWPAGRFVAGICGLAALGAAGAALAPSLGMVWLGYGAVFGAANGLGYGFGLQFAAQANKDRSGLAMGIVTAAYALGAALSPAAFDLAVGIGGFRAAMFGLAGALLLAGLVATPLIARAGLQFRSAAPERASGDSRYAPVLLLWVGYGAGVAAGLMAIGHAAGIAEGLRYAGPAWQAAAVIAVANLAGSLAAGRLADAMSPHALLTALPLISGAGGSYARPCCRARIGAGLDGADRLAYGGTIAAYPASIDRHFAPGDGPRIYGRVFTAWGTAGLLAPWFAGTLFDLSGGYRVALLTAAGFALVSALAILTLACRTQHK